VIAFGDFTLCQSLAMAVHLSDAYHSSHRFVRPRTAPVALAKLHPCSSDPKPRSSPPAGHVTARPVSKGEAPVVSGLGEGEVDLATTHVSWSLAVQAFIRGDTHEAPQVIFTCSCQWSERLGDLQPQPKARLDGNLPWPAVQQVVERTAG
jgi:hypothetical protein